MNGFENKIAAFVFDHLVAMKWAKGYRTYLAGASCILGGVAIALEMVINGHYSEEKAGACFAAFALGFKVIGDRGQKDG